MWRRRRWAFDLSAAVSALLFVAACALWVRSYWRHDLRMAKRGAVQTSASSVRGGVHFVRETGAYPFPPADQKAEWFTLPAFPTDTIDQRYGLRSRDWRLAGFAWIEGDAREGMIYPGEPPIPYRAVVVPWWFVAALFAVLPLARWASWLQRRRRATNGLCPTCGYDMRATPERCPECGRAPAGKEAAS
jgi:hypothetical protein